MRNGSFESWRLNRLRKNPFGLSFRGTVGDEESRKSFTFRARFLASLGMTRLRGVFPQPVRLLILGGVALLSVVTFASPPQQVQEPPLPGAAPAATVQTSPEKEIATQDVQPPLTLRVQRNVVVVRVIVRDANGRPVPKLRKEDFRLFDNGKEQAIDQFSVESPRVTPAAAPPAPGKPSEEKPAPGSAPASAIVAPQNYQALYFDDIQSELPDLNRARDAAERYLAATLTPADRVGIFTASGKGVLDFTADREPLHEALLELRPRPLFVESAPCIDIGPYEMLIGIVGLADRIKQCVGNTKQGTAPAMAGAIASRLREESMLTSEAELRGLEQVVRRTALLPGQRSVIMLCPGLRDYRLETRTYEIAERALGAGVVVNALNLRGLYAIIPGGDASQGTAPAEKPTKFTSPGLEGMAEVSAYARVEDVLYDFAAITGGQVFHNDNDLEKGLRRVGTLADVYYVLAFSPRNLKLDGRFHTLKVNLVNPARLTVQARHGYFAPRAAEDAATKAKEEIEQAMYSQDELKELPIDVHTQYYKVNESEAWLAVLTHLDLNAVRFRKEADRNRDDVTFLTVLFDMDGKYVTARQKLVKFRLRDATLARFTQTGITMKTEFDLKPGTYMVRQIVRDSEAGQLSGLSRTVEIPY
ncbi:MAG: VWA domain-containing protein [Terriglobia bacterium]